MARKRSPEDLTAEELRRLLVEKRRLARQDRLEQFQKTGRIVGDPPAPESVGVLGGQNQGSRRDRGARGRNLWLNRLLLVIEIAAVAGLLLILFNGYNLLQGLNRQFAEAFRQQTATPTPLVSAVVVPDGHTPPNALGETSFNEAEIPERLRPLAQRLANAPLPTPAPEQAKRVKIPAINVDAPVVQGDNWEQLQKGVGQHLGTPNPGQKGNMVLSGHNDVYGEVFRDLSLLKPGDTVIVLTDQYQYTYSIMETLFVAPTDIWVMDPTEDATLTLISCYPYLVDTQRIIVKAKLEPATN